MLGGNGLKPRHEVDAPVQGRATLSESESVEAAQASPSLPSCPQRGRPCSPRFPRKIPISRDRGGVHRATSNPTHRHAAGAWQAKICRNWHAWPIGSKAPGERQDFLPSLNPQSTSSPSCMTNGQRDRYCRRGDPALGGADCRFTGSSCPRGRGCLAIRSADYPGHATCSQENCLVIRSSGFNRFFSHSFRRPCVRYAKEGTYGIETGSKLSGTRLRWLQRGGRCGNGRFRPGALILQEARRYIGKVKCPAVTQASVIGNVTHAKASR